MIVTCTIFFLNLHLNTDFQSVFTRQHIQNIAVCVAELAKLAATTRRNGMRTPLGPVLSFIILYTSKKFQLILGCHCVFWLGSFVNLPRACESNSNALLRGIRPFGFDAIYAVTFLFKFGDISSPP